MSGFRTFVYVQVYCAVMYSDITDGYCSQLVDASPAVLSGFRAVTWRDAYMTFESVRSRQNGVCLISSGVEWWSIVVSRYNCIFQWSSPP